LLHCAPHGPHSAGKGLMGQRPLADAMPPREPLPGLHLQGLPKLAGASTALEQGFDVAQQMRPADAPRTPAVATAGTRCSHSSDRSPTTPRSAPPSVPGPPCPRATRGSHTR
jgi:hypothetical protein